jgi:dihydroorotase
MRIYIENVSIIDSNSPFNGQTLNLLLEDGYVKSINPEATAGVDHHFSSGPYQLSASWVDMRVFCGDPGEEYREDFESIRMVLSAGGFGHALLMPNTTPVLQHKSAVHAVLATNFQQALQLYPAAAISKDTEGAEMNEMLDLHTAGAKAFTDGEKPLWNSDLLVKTLQYLQKFKGLLMNFPQDRMLAMFGQMHEGIVSTGLGLKGIPSVAEEIMIQRDLELLRYAGGKIHFSAISTAKSVALIKAAKAEGLSVSCDVTIHHLILSDDALETFDTNYKVLPPLRRKEDNAALIAGVNEGVVDVIVSGHQPYNDDYKKMEFDLAAFGIMGAQIMYPLYDKYLKDEIPLSKFIACITEHPRKLLGITSVPLAEGAKADFTLFSSETPWTFDEKHNHSKSNNSPFLNNQFKAAALAVFNNEAFFISPFINNSKL